MVEADALQLVQVFTIYMNISIPCSFLTTTNLKKVDTMIQKGYKQAIKLPASTSTHRLLMTDITEST